MCGLECPSSCCRESRGRSEGRQQAVQSLCWNCVISAPAPSVTRSCRPDRWKMYFIAYWLKELGIWLVPTTGPDWEGLSWLRMQSHFSALKKAPKVKVNFRGNRNRIIVRYILIVLRIAVVWGGKWKASDTPACAPCVCVDVCPVLCCLPATILSQSLASYKPFGAISIWKIVVTR